jgi:hypothetical protein
MGDAHIWVTKVTARGEADLLVHRVNDWGWANRPWLWFMANKQDANVYVHFCSQGVAQLAVCFVDTYGQAGWVTKDHPCRRLLR